MVERMLSGNSQRALRRVGSWMKSGSLVRRRQKDPRIHTTALTETYLQCPKAVLVPPQSNRKAFSYLALTALPWGALASMRARAWRRPPPRHKSGAVFGPDDLDPAWPILRGSGSGDLHLCGRRSTTKSAPHLYTRATRSYSNDSRYRNGRECPSPAASFEYALQSSAIDPPAGSSSPGALAACRQTTPPGQSLST